MRFGFTVIFVLLLLVFSLPSFATESTSLPRGPYPIKVGIGLHIDDILQVTEKSETISFQGTMRLQWLDPRLAFTPTDYVKLKRYTNGAVEHKLNRIWKPQIHIVNARGKRQVEMRLLTITQAGIVTYQERFRVMVESRMNLRRFPFDKQALSIDFQPYSYTAFEVQLLPIKMGKNLSKSAPLEEWSVNTIKYLVRTVKMPHTDRVASQYTLIFHYNRKPIYYIAQIIIPIMFVVFLSFSVFWITQSSIVNRIAISLTAVLAVVVFQWRVYGDLPHISYLTFLDYFMLYSFIVAGLTIIASVIIEKKRKHLSYVQVCRIGFPLIYFLGVVFLAWFLL